MDWCSFSVRFRLLPAPKSVRPALTLSLARASLPVSDVDLSSLYQVSEPVESGTPTLNTFVTVSLLLFPVIQPCAKRLIRLSPLHARSDRCSQLRPAERCWWRLPSRRLRKVHLNPVGRKDHLGHHPGRCVPSSSVSPFVGLRPNVPCAPLTFAECPTCPYGGLDLSAGLFSAFASHDVGVSELTVSAFSVNQDR